MTDVTTVFPEGFSGQIVKILDDGKDTNKHSTYVSCVDHAEEMSWHVYGAKPEKLLKRVRPREDPAITTYRLESYQPITESICGKGLSIVHKIFDPNLWAIRFKDSTQAQELKKYTLEDYPVFNSVPSYLSDYLLKKMIADPNAVILVQPYNFFVPGNERVKPFATCYHSKDIWLIDEENILLFEKLEESKTQSGKTIKKYYFTYANKSSVFQLYFEKQDDNKGYEITTIAEYKHGFNELPVWFLTGEYSDDKCFKSFFQKAVPFWNKAINDDSDVDGAYRMHMWPQKWEVADECEYVERGELGNHACSGGYIFNGESKYKCPGCGGSGYKTAKSPYETHVVNRDKFLGTDGTTNLQVPFGYVTVPVEATKMLEERADRNLQKGLVALNMDVVNEIGLNQSGKAKEMDRTELNDFLKKISSVMYDIHMTNIYYYFTKYMFGVTDPTKIAEIQPEISKPTQFDVYSSAELTTQFKEAKTAKINPQYLTVLQTQIQNKEFSTNPILLERLNLMLALDPLSEVSPDEVSLQLANGTITKETAIIHDNIKVFISRALEEDKNFAKLEPSKQREVLEKYAGEVVEENKVKIDESSIEPIEPTKEPIEPKDE